MNLRCFPDWLLCLHSLVWNPCVVRLYVLFVAIILPWCHGAILSWFHGDTMGWWLHYVWRRPSDCPASWSPGPGGEGKWLWSSSLQIYCSVSGNITNITTPSLPHHHNHHIHTQQQSGPLSLVELLITILSLVESFPSDAGASSLMP